MDFPTIWSTPRAGRARNHGATWPRRWSGRWERSPRRRITSRRAGSTSSRAVRSQPRHQRRARVQAAITARARCCPETCRAPDHRKAIGDRRSCPRVPSATLSAADDDAASTCLRSGCAGAGRPGPSAARSTAVRVDSIDSDGQASRSTQCAWPSPTSATAPRGGEGAAATAIGATTAITARNTLPFDQIPRRWRSAAGATGEVADSVKDVRTMACQRRPAWMFLLRSGPTSSNGARVARSRRLQRRSGASTGGDQTAPDIRASLNEVERAIAIAWARGSGWARSCEARARR